MGDKEKAIVTEVEKSMARLAVNKAFESWSKNPTNDWSVNKLNRALGGAYNAGVSISLKISQEALESPNAVHQPLFEKLRKLNPRLKDEVVINSIDDAPNSLRTYKGIIATVRNSSYLCILVSSETESYFLARLKPTDIDSFTPIQD